MASMIPSHRVRTVLLAGALLLALSLPLLVMAQDGDQPLQTHVVQRGESALGIAARYGISLAQLVETNNLRSLALIPGTRLVIPAPPGQATIHLVRPWDTLPLLAARYGVPILDIMQANGLTRPDTLFVGQRLLIPLPAQPPAMPTPPPIATPLACSAGCAQISIMAPQRDSTITSPVRVTGRGTAYEQTLVVRVLDATGYEIGKGNAMIDGPLGAIAPYSGVITFTVPAGAQPGRIQVYSQSPADGAIEQLVSVPVTLQGAGLDEAIEQLKYALETQNYEALASLMTDPWSLIFFRSEGLALDKDRALEQLRVNYLGPGQVFVDLSVDGRSLLADRFRIPADVTHVVYSTGWGPDRGDDALLLFGPDAAGQTRWSGMIYIFQALRPYAAP